MNKKAAICISGHFRTYLGTYNNYIDNIINPLLSMNYQIDVFIHTWTKLGPEKTGATFRSGSKEMSEADININDIREKYDPKYFFIEDYELIKHNFLTNLYTHKKYNNEYDKEFGGILYQIPAYYKRFMCNMAKCIYEKNNNFEYDIVFIYRPDCLLESVVDLTDYDKNNLYAWNLDHDFKGFFDQFLYGGSKSINCLTDIFKNLRSIYDREVCFGPEKGLYMHTVTDNNINVINTNRPFRILRCDGSL